MYKRQTLGRIFFLNIFSTISGTQAITRGRISANDSAMILGAGIRVRNHRSVSYTHLDVYKRQMLSAASDFAK